VNGDSAMLAEAFGLTPKTLSRVAHRTQQWGEAIEREISRPSLSDDVELPSRDDRERKRREVASLFAIAGSYRLLLDVDEAAGSLRRSARHFAALGSAFAHPLAVCGTEAEISIGALGEDRPLSAEERGDVLLALGWLDLTAPTRVATQARNALQGHLELAGAVAETPVGRLRIPLDAAARVISAADSVAHEGTALDPLAASLHDALIRIHDVIAAAMRDRFHWRRLLSSVLPVEPEAAALGAIAMAAVMRHEADDEILRQFDLPRVTIAPLLVGREIARSAR